MRFILAGNAWFAIKSLKTGTVFQYRVNASKSNQCMVNTATKAWWVEALGSTTGDMSSPYQYIGGLYRRDNNTPKFYKGNAWTNSHGHTTNPLVLSPELEAFTWLWDKLVKNMLPPSLEFYHIGRCARCGHKLTDEKSIKLGFGPTCYRRVTEE